MTPAVNKTLHGLEFKAKRLTLNAKRHAQLAIFRQFEVKNRRKAKGANGS